MNETAENRHGTRGAALLATFTLAIFTSAFLLFFIQPMFTKMVLPHLGGSPAVWSIAMVVFQALLLAGYGYAHLSTTRPFHAKFRAPAHRAAAGDARCPADRRERPPRRAAGGWPGLLAHRRVPALGRPAVLCGRGQWSASAGLVLALRPCPCRGSVFPLWRLEPWLVCGPAALSDPVRAALLGEDAGAGLGPGLRAAHRVYRHVRAAIAGRGAGSRRPTRAGDLAAPQRLAHLRLGGLRLHPLGADGRR